MIECGYYVIGGQYRRHCYGHRDTLTGAKRLASRSAEYWDNWQGWQTPSIYRAEDCMETPAGDIIPRPDVVPDCVYDDTRRRWVQHWLRREV